MISQWFVYILECSDSTLYTGITNNLEKRVEDHNSGFGAKYTRVRTPVKLVYYEKYNNRSEASKREYIVKGFSRAKKLMLVEYGL